VTGAGTLSISLVKGFEPPQVFGGAASTMSIDIINPGTVPFTGITFTDSMPPNMILANPTNFNVGTCGGTLTGNPGDNSFVFAGGSLPALGSCTLTLSATMTVNGNLTNTIAAGAIKTDGNLATNADPTSASLTNLPGASVSKAFSPNPIPTGSYSLLTITVQNTGNIGLTGMGVSDSLPTGLEIAGGSAPAPVNNCSGTLTAVSGTQLIELANGALAGNATCTIVVAITGSSPGDFENTIPEGSLHADPNTSNTSPATATLTITGEPVAASGGGGGGGGRARTPRTRTVTTATTFLIPVTAGFAPGITTKLDAASRQAYDATGLSIDIPDLKLKTSIVGVESQKNGWDISWLQNEVGWLNGTAYPTWKGNSVLTAHVVNADGKPGLFYNLKALGVGEFVYLYNAGYRYTYQVVSNSFVRQDDSSLMKHEDKQYLTLFTCDTYDVATGKYLRYVEVRAVLVDVRQER
jgi:LPXTG-site transpeptidase (sortase) family protein